MPDTAPVGSRVLTARAYNPLGGPLRWSLPDTTLGRFSIDPDHGDLMVASPLSRHGRSAMEFMARASNQQGLSCDILIRVSIVSSKSSGGGGGGGDHSSSGPYQAGSQLAFDQAQYAFTVSNCNAGDMIGLVRASGGSGIM